MKLFPSLHALALACAAGCAAGSALAQDATAPWLPAPAQVAAALQAQPVVRAAAERVQAASATQRALEVGSHELQANAGVQQRHVRDEQRRYHEWELGLSRTLRLPRKAALDRQIGDGTYHLARLRLEDAEHQVARRLLDAWMHWLRSSALAAETAAQSQLLERERDAVARRLALGDAAQRDVDALEAERATQAAQALMARDAQAAARQLLILGFAPIAVPDQPAPLPDPTEWLDHTQDWRARILSESAEVAIARSTSRLQARTAERARAERTPDPTVGVRILSDRGGRERTVGVVLSVPLGTAHRSAIAATETANAHATEAEAADVLRTIEQESWLAVQTAHSTLAQWQALQQALAAQTAASQRTHKAWELGEAPLSEYLLALRNLHQARLAETQARVDALQAALRVRIDAHALWHSAAAPEKRTHDLSENK